MNTHRGFTLIELMYALALAGIVLAVGVPTFNSTMRNSAMVTSTNALLTSLHAARTEAVKRRVRVTLCPTVDGSECADGDSLLVFADPDDNAQFDAGAGDVLIQVQPWLRGSVELVVDETIPGYVSFGTSGFTRDVDGNPIAGNMMFCDDRGNESARVLMLSATGRAQIVMRAELEDPQSCSS